MQIQFNKLVLLSINVWDLLIVRIFVCDFLEVATQINKFAVLETKGFVAYRIKHLLLQTDYYSHYMVLL